jgi:hypothetical protein
MAGSHFSEFFVIDKGSTAAQKVTESIPEGEPVLPVLSYNIGGRL